MAKQGNIDSQTPVSTNPNVPHPSPEPGSSTGFVAPGAATGLDAGNEAPNIPGFAHPGLP